jgi:hypothetical protein
VRFHAAPLGSRRPFSSWTSPSLGPRPVRLTFQEAVFGSSRDLHLQCQVSSQGSGGQLEIKDRDVKLDTPPGIDDRINLRVSGQGAQADPGAPRGNLLVQVIVEDDDYFVRDVADVHAESPIFWCRLFWELPSMSRP